MRTTVLVKKVEKLDHESDDKCNRDTDEKYFETIFERFERAVSSNAKASWTETNCRNEGISDFPEKHRNADSADRECHMSHMVFALKRK